ncbi:MAG: ASKHA domain-containing protein [Oscillospiraceae bacterium]|nr:ASKHA domain-containing protein [Oscillospiraceae bacterium]
MKIYRNAALLTETSCAAGETVLQALSHADVFLDAPCGGRGRCGKCTVRLSPDGEEVRACQTRIEGGLSVYLPDEMKMEIAGQNPEAAPAAPENASPHGTLGVAVDIGTTTVVAHLTDLATGARLATASGVNAQRPYGADVISRIEYSAANGHETLTRLIQTQLNALILDACGKCGARPSDIAELVVAGNTIMEHLAAGFSPVGMGAVPFTPVSLFGESVPAWDGLPAAPDARVYFAPCVSSYVGGDITAGMLACGLERDAGPTVFIDIGTNGEIAMKRGSDYLCCATAAGPAFEGAEISKGMAAIPGAVSHVKWGAQGLEMTVLGGAEPAGLCGSGLLDALALLLDTGAVDETGRLLDPDEFSHPIAAHLGKAEGQSAFYLSRERGVYLSARDIRKLQLAKAAIAAGIQTLLLTAGLTNADVRSFILAGGFGSFMDQNSAARIGLFPREFLAVTRSMGNTAGEGASLALISAEARKTLDQTRARCEYVELSSSLTFNEQFVEQMMFE